MCLLMSNSYKGTSESNGNCDIKDESTKEGACLLELRRTGMVKWGDCKQAATVSHDGEHEEINPLPSTTVVKEEQKDEEAEAENLTLSEIRKGKRPAPAQLGEARASKHAKQKLNGTLYTHKKFKQENSKLGKKEKSKSRSKENISRWSIERYKLAEERMLEVMKAEGAVIDNPITRPKLRLAARKHICDTGLLDHLLKHIDGKVAPGGTERFRRIYNTEGTMEYWLESADVIKIKREAGLPDVSWCKPSAAALQDSVFSEELTRLKDEIAMMKRDMEGLTSKNQGQDNRNLIEEMHKELIKWKSQIDERIMQISTSLGSMQNMYKELAAWKSKTEQQLTEISSVLSNMQSSRQPVFNTEWEDWLESSNLDNIQGQEFSPWLENTDLINGGQGVSLQEPCLAPQPWLKPCGSPPKDPICTRELELLKEEMARMKRDVQELVPKRSGEDQANLTPDSSLTANSKLDLDSSFLLFQEMFKELMKWKAKMEQQMLELSNSVHNLQASKLYTF